MRHDLTILGEFDPNSETHRATDAAIRHSLFALGAKLEASWISTARVGEADVLQAHGLWIAPGSPYKDMSRAIEAIRLARANLVPCLGTCGGFQHMILEFACNVLGFTDAQHAEYNPDASRLFISTLSCSVLGMELHVRLQPQTIAHRLYGNDEVVERYFCTFGVIPSMQRRWLAAGIWSSPAETSMEKLGSLKSALIHSSSELCSFLNHDRGNRCPTRW